MIDDVLTIDDGSGTRRVRLADYLDARAEEGAIASELEWIKRLRQLDVGGQPLRRRFTLRGDSLWWFAELYLHKQQVVLNTYRTIAALDALIARERPAAIGVVRAGQIVRSLAPQAARGRGIRYRGGSGAGGATLRMVRMDLRARALTFAARASRARTAAVLSRQPPTKVAAFVHRAVWRSGAPEGSAESYIGPVLEALENRAAGRVQYISVGPSENFRARRWWHPFVKKPD